MNITRDVDGNVTIVMDNHAEAVDLCADLVCAADQPGTDICSPLISEFGVAALTVRVLP